MADSIDSLIFPKMATSWAVMQTLQDSFPYLSWGHNLHNSLLTPLPALGDPFPTQDTLPFLSTKIPIGLDRTEWARHTELHFWGIQGKIQAIWWPYSALGHCVAIEKVPGLSNPAATHLSQLAQAWLWSDRLAGGTVGSLHGETCSRGDGTERQHCYAETLSCGQIHNHIFLRLLASGPASHQCSWNSLTIWGRHGRFWWLNGCHKVNIENVLQMLQQPEIPSL